MQEAIPKSITQVFRSDELRELILSHAIRDANNQVCWSTVRSLRRVSVPWSLTIMKLLRPLHVNFKTPTGSDGESSPGGNEVTLLCSALSFVEEEERGSGSSPTPLEQVKMEEPLESVTEVFRDNFLREKILKEALQGPNNKLSRSTAASLRLVQKSWLKSTTKLFQSCQEPLFKLILTKDNSVTGTPYVIQNGKLLDQFVSTVSTYYGSIDDICPTFSLKLKEHYFLRQNYEGLYNSFNHCGGALTQLEMAIPVNGGSLKCIFPAFYLSSLKTLTLHLSKVTVMDPSGAPQQQQDNVTYLLHTLLGGAPNLTDLIVRYPRGQEGTFLGAVGFEYLTLPATLTRLILECELTAGDLEMLAKCSLPKLTSLALQVPDRRAYPDGALYKILKNFPTLKRFAVFKSKDYQGSPRNVTQLGFPFMKSLRILVLESINLELEGGLLHLDKNPFPKLNFLKLGNQTPAMLSKWTGEGLSLGFVKHLNLSFANEAVGFDHNDFRNELDGGAMEGVARTFCNLKKLTVTVRGRETRGLEVVFKNFGEKLEELKLVVVGSGTCNADYWDAVLIGAPVKFLAGLKDTREFWERIELRSDEETPSIRNMKALKTITLEAEVGLNSCGRKSALKPFISDVAFHFALLKMDKLRSLRFKGRFRASSEMADEWRRLGRSYVYTSPSRAASASEDASQLSQVESQEA